MGKLADAFLPEPRVLHRWPSLRFSVKRPRSEAPAGIPLARICAGGGQQCASLPRTPKPEPWVPRTTPVHDPVTSAQGGLLFNLVGNGCRPALLLRPSRVRKNARRLSFRSAGLPANPESMNTGS
jgi:hypothetical protein